MNLYTDILVDFIFTLNISLIKVDNFLDLRRAKAAMHGTRKVRSASQRRCEKPRERTERTRGTLKISLPSTTPGIESRRHRSSRKRPSVSPVFAREEEEEAMVKVPDVTQTDQAGDALGTPRPPCVTYGSKTTLPFL